jgi:sugar lactone lactonase YvrE
MRADQLTDPLAYHGEGPVWLAGTRWPRGLYWLDMLAGDVLHLGADGTVERRHVGTTIALVRPRDGGGLVYAVERGFALDDGPGTALRNLPELWDNPGVRMNEGGCDPAGRLYCGSMSYQAETAAGSLYLLHPDGAVDTVAGGFTIPNGLEWTPDGTQAYHVDTPTGRIDILDWNADEGLHNRRPFANVEGDGQPDGLTVDADGGVWVAVWGGRAVHCYGPDGSLSAVVEVPAAQVSACTFGGPDLEELFITTSRENLDDPEPAAGAVFSVRPGVRGRPVRPFAG